MKESEPPNKKRALLVIKPQEGQVVKYVPLSEHKLFVDAFRALLSSNEDPRDRVESENHLSARHDHIPPFGDD